MTIPIAQVSTRPASDLRVVYGKEILVWSLILLFVFVVAAMAIIRFSRRYKVYLVRHEKRPTPNADVWAMHQLPKGADGNLPEDSDEPK